MITRRGFLGTSIAGFGASAIAPGLLTRASAQEPAQEPLRDDGRRILVVVQLSGGNDGLNTVVPFADDAYHRARPKLRIEEKDVLRLDERTGLHPSMKTLRRRFDAGEVAIVQSVGYPRHNRSHFRSMAIWHAADPDEGAARTGWVGRAADLLDAAGTDPAVAIGLSNPLPFALQRERSSVLAFEGEDGFALAADRRFQQGRAAQVETFRKLCSEEASSGTYADRVRAHAAAGLSAADALLTCLRSGRTQGTYPRGAGGKLAQVARLIAGGQRSRLFYVTAGGYDTHARQKDAHAGLLAAFSDGVDAFFQDLETAGRAEDVVLVAFSEFGRRLAENGSQGTDHGTAGPMFVVGPSVRGGLVGEPPELAKDGDQDPEHKIDFRAVYATLVERWLGLSAETVVGAGHGPLAFLA